MPFTRVEHLDAVDSTNSELLRRLDAEPEAWPPLAVLVARDQTAGRGRAGRAWATAPGALALSVVLDADDGLPETELTTRSGADAEGGPRPVATVPAGADAGPHPGTHLPLTLLPLAVGVAVARALAPWVQVGLKWPNDVVAVDLPPVPEYGWPPKLGGILLERHRSGLIAAGVGINVAPLGEARPVPWAESVAGAMELRPGSSPTDPGKSPGVGVGAAGVFVASRVERGASAPPPSVDDVLAALGDHLPEVLDLPAPALLAEYEAWSVVLGAPVSIAHPDGLTTSGTARHIDKDGALILATPAGERRVTVGDVERARPW